MSSDKSVFDFEMNHYISIAANKTAHYTYNLPVALGMVLAGVTNDQELELEIHSILQEIGCLFQIQDDFLDCFGSPEFGKIGNDIKNRKCTWLSVKFMELGTEKEKEVFAEIYGRTEPEAVQQVKNLYQEVGIVEAFKLFEDESCKSIQQRINSLPDHIPKGLFRDFIDNIYQRKV